MHNRMQFCGANPNALATVRVPVGAASGGERRPWSLFDSRSNGNREPVLMMERSPVPDFVSAFAARRTEDLEPFLHEDVVYVVAGLPEISGRRAVLQLWRRVFQSYASIDARLVRHVPDGDLVMTEQRQVLTRRDGGRLQIDSIVIYTLNGGLIASWSDHLELDVLPSGDAALWRRLWTARW